MHCKCFGFLGRLFWTRTIAPPTSLSPCHTATAKLRWSGSCLLARGYRDAPGHGHAVQIQPQDETGQSWGGRVLATEIVAAVQAGPAGSRGHHRRNRPAALLSSRNISPATLHAGNNVQARSSAEKIIIMSKRLSFTRHYNIWLTRLFSR